MNTTKLSTIAPRPSWRDQAQDQGESLLPTPQSLRGSYRDLFRSRKGSSANTTKPLNGAGGNHLASRRKSSTNTTRATEAIRDQLTCMGKSSSNAFISHWTGQLEPCTSRPTPSPSSFPACLLDWKPALQYATHHHSALQVEARWQTLFRSPRSISVTPLLMNTTLLSSSKKQRFLANRTTRRTQYVYTSSKYPPRFCVSATTSKWS
jgi:hypothetical protein